MGRADTGPGVAFGTAASLIDRLARIRDELGLSGIVFSIFPVGAIPAGIAALVISTLFPLAVSYV